MDFSNLANQYGATFTPVNPSNSNDLNSIASKYGATFTPTPAPVSRPDRYIGSPLDILLHPIQTLQDTGSQIAGAFNSGVNQIKGAFTNSQAGRNPIETGAQLGAGLINTALSPLAPITKPIGDVTNAIVDKVSDVPAVQQFANSKAGEVASRVADLTGNLSTIAGVAAGGPELSKEVPTIVDSAKTNFVNRTVENTVNDWNRIGGDYVKTTKLLDGEQARLSNTNSPTSLQDTPTFLAEHGISPQSLIENGKFHTSEIADKLTNETIKPFEDTLTKQLKVAQYGQPLTQISELRNPLIKSIESTKGITPDITENLVNIAENKLGALERKYPNGIPLDQLNIEKGNFWKGTKFDITKPLDPQVNYQIGTAMKDLIESKAGDANVKELNGVLGNYYKAAKFLNGLENRVPKLTTGQKIFRGVVKATTTGIGEKLFGLTGGVGGFLLGKSVSHLLENVSNPVRGYILNHLKTADPAAYTKAVQWLGEKEAQRLTTPALPAPTAETLPGGAKNPIKPTAPTTYEKQPNIVNRTSVNPKTGTQYVKDLKTGKTKVINR